MRRLRLRHLGRRGYRESLARMQAFTAARDGESVDEIWVLEHPPVFTLGQAALQEHLLATGDIEVVQTDRGGQVTYHGPGQVVVYTLLDLARRRLGVREMVTLLEQAVIDTLAAAGIAGERRAGAPGVYVADAKIAALGLRVRRGRCYHGLALNVDMDLEPFSRINPCGYAGLAVTSLRALGDGRSPAEAADAVIETLRAGLGVEVADVETGGADWPRTTTLAS